MKYTITLEDNDRCATAYIETRRPLTGKEPVVAERLQTLDSLVESDDSQHVEELSAQIAKQWTETA